ncbi:hypothetical protein EY643_14535 [Halioglobus maricola]|uniref:DUF2282 domain-containing protein n=1 Tax=Halioglobus maricola TaxID=2601894 RepID=A0A5P9NLS6_9GAMM|nr:hypothetical protein [Halioglobus maricola]QFU76771.1 hypothetical protein EY643_14535 [Halioglobus maricola]
MKSKLLITCLLFSAYTHADVFPKVDGDCPTGSYSSGDYCKTFSSTDKRGIKIVANTSGGRCPTGWYKSGGYCKAYGAKAAEEEVIEKVGDRCPTGMYTSGGFCKSYK